MTKLTVAALQLAFTDDTATNIKAVAELVREAHSKGAEVVLPPELFEGPYFCRVEDEALFASALPTAEHPSVLAMQELAAELKIWIPTSFFEAEGPHHYNSLAMPRIEVDSVATVRDGANVYRLPVRDISQGGIKVEGDPALEYGCDLSITLPGLEPQPGALRWRHDGHIGLSFNRLLPLAELVGWLQGIRDGLRAAS